MFAVRKLLRTPLVVVIVALTFGALTPLRASGATIDDKKAEAAHLEAEIQANGDRIAALGEQYNGACSLTKTRKRPWPTRTSA